MNQESLVEKIESLAENVLKRHGKVMVAFGLLTPVLGDFFSPLKAQYITAAIAVICGIAAVRLALKHKRDCLNIALFQYLVAGVVVCGVPAAITNAYADKGGVLASEFDQVKAYQSMMGIMTGVQKDVAQIRQDTTDIKQAMLTLDKETSANPRKELAKRGMPWHWMGFIEAATSGELEETHLYRQAGMKSIGDCFALKKLFLEYQGAPENRAAIWEEVLGALGNSAVNEECWQPIYLNETGLMPFSAMNPEVKASLVESGKYYQQRFGYPGYPDTPVPFNTSLLMLAVLANDPEMVKLFLAHGAKPDVGMEVSNGPGAPRVLVGNAEVKPTLAEPVTPLAEAKRRGLKDIVDILLQH